MKSSLAAAAVLALACVLAGCGAIRLGGGLQGQPPAFSTHPDLLFYAAGGCLMVVGVITLAVKKLLAGAVLFAGGIGIAWFGQSLVKHEWMSLIATLIPLAALVLAAVMAGLYLWRSHVYRKTVEKRDRVDGYLVKAVELAPEAKGFIGAGKPAAEAEAARAEVKEVVTPIKTALRRNGEI